MSLNISISSILSKIISLIFALSSFNAMWANFFSSVIFPTAAILTASSLSSMTILSRTSSLVKFSFRTAVFLMELSLALKTKSYNTSALSIFSRALFLYLLSWASIAIHSRVLSSTILLKISSTLGFFLVFITISAIDLLFSPSLSHAKLRTS